MTDDEEYDDTEYEDDEPTELETSIIGLLTDRVIGLEARAKRQSFETKVLMAGLVLTGFGFVFVNKLLTNIVGAINAGQPQAMPGGEPTLAPQFNRVQEARPDVPVRNVGDELVVDETLHSGDPVAAPHDPIATGDVETPFAESVPEVHQAPWQNGMGVVQEPGSRTYPHG